MASNDSNITVEGGIDASWTSDLKDRKVKGKNEHDDDAVTVEYATPTDEELGDTNFDFLPSDVDAEDLTDLQRGILQAAYLRNPESLKAIADYVDCTPTMVGNTLREFAPERHEAIKMAPSECARARHGTSSAEAPATNTAAPEPEPEQTSAPSSATADGGADLSARIDLAVVKCATLEAVHPDEPVGRFAAELRETLEGER